MMTDGFNVRNELKHGDRLAPSFFNSALVYLIETWRQTLCKLYIDRKKATKIITLDFTKHWPGQFCGTEV
jgi:hypothetical protein